MKAPCANCPFSTSVDGTHLRDSLADGRLVEIIETLKRDGHFFCHKTVEHDDDDSERILTQPDRNKLCAGALAWQHARALSNQYERLCERLDHITQRGNL